MTEVSRERRRAPRVEVNAVRDLALPVTVPVEVVEISENGVLIKSPGRMEASRHCRLRLLLGHEPLVAEVTVARCSSAPPGGDGFRIAAVFTAMTAENHRVLQRFLERKGV